MKTKYYSLEKILAEYKKQPKWKGKIFMKDEEICFLDGLEIGYNKAKEVYAWKEITLQEEIKEK